MPKDDEKQEKKKQPQPDLGADFVKKKRQTQEFERLVGPFFRFWEDGTNVLARLRNLMQQEDKQHFDKLLKDFKASGTNLYTFLRDARSRTQKGKL